MRETRRFAAAEIKGMLNELLQSMKVNSHHFELEDLDARSGTARPSSQLSRESKHVQLYCVELELPAIRVTVVDRTQLHPKHAGEPAVRSMEVLMVRTMIR